MGLQDSVSCICLSCEVKTSDHLTPDEAKYCETYCKESLHTIIKQQWEKTVEQRILHGLTHVMKKTAKLKTDLIDVDLVRGSSFPKAKPKHGIITVTKLALIRWLLLPFYSYWWIEQTCFTTFSLLLLLYILQLCNMIIYFFNYEDRLFEHISTHEVLVPAGMMLVLSIIHSQIISTNNCSQNFSKSRSKRRRIKRRNFIFDNKEVYSSKESVSSTPSSKTKTNVSNETVENTTSRRKNIGWRVPLQSVTELKDCELNDEPDKMYRGNNYKNVQSVGIEDDGFESFNSNGSSENGDDIQDISRIGQVFCGEEVVGSVTKCSESLKSKKLINERTDEKKEKRSAVLKKSNDNLEFNDNDMYNNVKDSNLKESSFEKKDVDCDFHLQSRIRNIESSCPNLSRRDLECKLHLNCELCDNETDHKDTDSDVSNAKVRAKKSTSPQRVLLRRRGSLSLQAKTTHASFYNSSCESDENDRFDEPVLNECTTSAAEWIGITTNSEDCSVTSEIEESDSPSKNKVFDDHPFAWEFQLSPSILSPSCASSDKVSCTIWENNDVKRADLSVLDISSAIIARVETMRETMDYFYVGILVSCITAFLPSLRRLIEITQENSISSNDASSNQMDPLLSLKTTDLSDGLFIKIRGNVIVLLETAFGSNFLERFVILTALFERLMLSILFFFLVAVAERTFKQRFLYAKFFSRLTSFRRARKSELPHFRLNKVRNIKTWLSVRSYLKKRGPQRSVDVIVSTAFIVTLLLLSFLSVELLKDSMRLQSEKNLEAVIWCLVLGGYLLRFMTLGNKTNRKYRNLSVLLTEQINLYLQIEQKPHKKDELMVANSVLKLAADLLKELECPFKISGLSANPYVYTITKVVILSALSGVLSELLGFKLKLHKIKIK